MSRALGPVSVTIEDGLATLTCSLYGATHTVVTVEPDWDPAWGDRPEPEQAPR
jgi:hypothetical protein